MKKTISTKQRVKIAEFLASQKTPVYKSYYGDLSREEYSESVISDVNELKSQKTDLFVFYENSGARGMELIFGEAEIDHEFGLVCPKGLCLLELSWVSGSRRNGSAWTTLMALVSEKGNKCIDDFIVEKTEERDSNSYCKEALLTDGRTVMLWGGATNYLINFHYRKVFIK